MHNKGVGNTNGFEGALGVWMGTLVWVDHEGDFPIGTTGVIGSGIEGQVEMLVGVELEAGKDAINLLLSLSRRYLAKERLQLSLLRLAPRVLSVLPPNKILRLD
jgi:hypothetical protein